MKKLNLLTLAVLSTFALVACSSESSQKQNAPASSETLASSSEAVQTSSESVEQTTYKIGDTVTFDNEMSIVITGAEWTDERNQFDDTNPERVLKVTYNVSNLSSDELFVGSELALYVNGSKMESYPNTNTMESISAGRNLEGAIQHFGVNGSGTMEIEAVPSFSFNAEPKIITLDIQ